LMTFPLPPGTYSWQNWEPPRRPSSSNISPNRPKLSLIPSPSRQLRLALHERRRLDTAPAPEANLNARAQATATAPAPAPAPTPAAAPASVPAPSPVPVPVVVRPPVPVRSSSTSSTTSLPHRPRDQRITGPPSPIQITRRSSSLRHASRPSSSSSSASRRPESRAQDVPSSSTTVEPEAAVAFADTDTDLNVQPPTPKRQKAPRPTPICCILEVCRLLLPRPLCPTIGTTCNAPFKWPASRVHPSLASSPAHGNPRDKPRHPTLALCLELLPFSLSLSLPPQRPVVSNESYTMSLLCPPGLPDSLDPDRAGIPQVLSILFCKLPAPPLSPSSVLLFRGQFHGRHLATGTPRRTPPVRAASHDGDNHELDPP
jgi:hypothetical protein